VFGCAADAGDVVYDVGDFPDKNKDTLTRDIMSVVKASESPLVQRLFEDVDPDAEAAAAAAGGARKKATSAGFKIKQQVCELRSAYPGLDSV
jgi:myosin heavy subunit